ncbi:MAG: hypothetical protein ACHQJ6_03080 [Candidatus Berkiellales bacterium]
MKIKFNFYMSYFLFLCLLPHFAYAKIICVDANAKSGRGNGSCWEKPFIHFQFALDEAERDPSVTEIWLADGIYRPNKSYAPKNGKGVEVVGGAMSLSQYNPGVTESRDAVNYHDKPELYNRFLQTFELVNKIDIYGGFQGQSHPMGGEKTKNDRSKDITLHQTLLDGNLGDIKVWHVLTAGNDLTLKGIEVKLDRLTIRNGNANNAPFFPMHYPLNPGEVPIYYHDDGAGLIVFIQSQIELNQVIFENNKAIAGGAIFAHDGSTLKISNCLFKNNSAMDGGAIHIRSGGPSELKNISSRVSQVNIEHCEFIHNFALIGSALIASDNQDRPPKGLSGPSIIIKQCKFANNTGPQNLNRGDIVALYGAIHVIDSELLGF